MRWAVGDPVRIVSLLPSTTEILFAIGAGDDVVGVTFECDYPEEARTRRIVSTSAMPEGLTPAEIDAFVVARDRPRRRPLPPRRGCPAPVSTPTSSSPRTSARSARSTCPIVDDALAHLGCTAEVLTVDPHTLDEVLALDRDRSARPPATRRRRPTLVRYQRRRLAALWGRSVWRPRAAGDVPGVDRPAVRTRSLDPRDDRARRRRVALLGTGGREVAPDHLGRRARGSARRRGRGARAATTARAARRWRTTWSRAASSRPAYRCTPSTPTPPGPGPGTRLVDGVEELARLLHPDEVLTETVSGTSGTMAP